MSNFVVHLPVRIVFGQGEVARVADNVKVLGRRAYLLADPYWASVGLADKVRTDLEAAGIKTAVFSAVDPNPQWADVDRVGEMLRQFSAEVVIGLGGGSAIDMAKAVAVAATHEGSVEGYVNWNAAPKKVTSAVLPVVAISTTAGTGAEVTQAAVMSDPLTHRKTAIFSENLFPRVAIVDPDLTATLPPVLTAATGLDALSHSIEGMMNAQKRNPFVDALSLDAISTISQYLPRAYHDGRDMEARSRMSWAAVLGGISIAVSGTTVPHGLGQPLGARANVHHGLSIAAFLPAIIERSWEAEPVLFARIATAMGTSQIGLSVGAQARSAAGAVRSLVSRVGLDAEIAKIAITQATAEDMVADATSYLGRLNERHIHPLSKAELMDIIKDSITVR
jgi:alcohol dehydrogenase class IV